MYSFVSRHIAKKVTFFTEIRAQKLRTLGRTEGQLIKVISIFFDH